MRLSPPTPALVVAALALTVSLGGVSYAAVSLPRGSVGTPQLQRKAVVTGKIAAGAVTSRKVRNGSLTGADVNEATLVMPGGALTFAGSDFKPISSAATFADGVGGSMYGAGRFKLRLDVPQGARFRSIKVFVYNDSSALPLDASLTVTEPAVSDVAEPELVRLPAGAGGQTLDVTPTSPLVVDNARFAYHVVVELHDGDQSQGILGAQVRYSQAVVGTAP